MCQERFGPSSLKDARQAPGGERSPGAFAHIEVTPANSAATAFPVSVDPGWRSDERENYENFLPAAPFPVSLVGVNGETAGALLFLFLSAFGFFFSRLLLN